MQIGRRIYYELATGNVIQDTGERSGSVVPTTEEQDYASYQALAARVPETVGVIELEYGQYAQDFVEASGYQVDPDTHEVLFSYPDPGEPDAPPVYQTPLTTQVAQLQDDNAGLMLELAEMSIRQDMSDQTQADLLVQLVMGGVI